MSNVRTPFALLAFGVVALVGLIVLSGTGHLDPAVRETLTSIATSCVVGAGALALPSHTHTPAAVTRFQPVTPAAPRTAPAAPLAVPDDDTYDVVPPPGDFFAPRGPYVPPGA